MRAEENEEGGPVTVTHPEITRFFMTIPEACQLILEATTLGRGGEIFILKMGTPVRIADMARDLIILSGKEPNTDIKIEFTGLRPGEKLFEELITEDEGVVETEHEKIMVLKANGLKYGNIIFREGLKIQDHDQELFRKWLYGQIDELITISDTYNGNAIRNKLKEIVPEYTPQDSECVL